MRGIKEATLDRGLRGNLPVSAVNRAAPGNIALLYSSESAETAAVGDAGCTPAFDIDLLIEAVKLFFFDRNVIVVSFLTESCL